MGIVVYHCRYCTCAGNDMLVFISQLLAGAFRQSQIYISVGFVLDCYIILLILADSDIRFCVLSSLDERFDAHLAQAENLSALFVALNDEVHVGCSNYL